MTRINTKRPGVRNYHCLNAILRHAGAMRESNKELKHSFCRKEVDCFVCPGCGQLNYDDYCEGCEEKEKYMLTLGFKFANIKESTKETFNVQLLFL